MNSEQGPGISVEGWVGWGSDFPVRPAPSTLPLPEDAAFPCTALCSSLPASLGTIPSNWDVRSGREGPEGGGPPSTLGFTPTQCFPVNNQCLLWSPQEMQSARLGLPEKAGPRGEGAGLQVAPCGLLEIAYEATVQEVGGELRTEDQVMRAFVSLS